MFSFGITSSDVKKIVWTFIQAFIASFYALATGLGRFPNLSEVTAFGWAAALAGLAAAVSLIKNGILSDASAIK